ncbi:MAG: glycosyltransferase [Neisseriaceae bacterium]|nr:glycosyltransferase [Neisseriaceae bacterium]
MSRIYLISDNLTRQSLLLEDNLNIKEPSFLMNKKDNAFLFCESAWQGYKNKWKFKIAAYPDYPKRNNQKLLKLLDRCKNKGIPTVFWDKEGCVHFERFKDSAKHFDHIFTVDECCIEKYRAIVPENTTVHLAMFPIQPKIHYFNGFNFKHLSANFVGSYSTHIHPQRQQWQEMLFQAALTAQLPVTVFDRNSNRKNQVYRYPERFHLNVQPALSYQETARVYRDYLISLNVNTAENSTTMFSRRVVEVLACGGILISTPSKAVERLFSDYCYIVDNEEETVELFNRLKHGATPQDLERAKAGSDFVIKNFSWNQFLQRIKEVVWCK